MNENTFNRLPYRVEAVIKGVGKKGINEESYIPVGIVNSTDTSKNVTVEQLTTLTPTWIDEPDDNTTYIGYSTDGNKANATTAIYKIAKSSTVTEFYVGSGGTAFNQIWNTRASLTYQYNTV